MSNRTVKWTCKKKAQLYIDANETEQDNEFSLFSSSLICSSTQKDKHRRV
jgi:hypothetical protein